MSGFEGEQIFNTDQNLVNQMNNNNNGNGDNTYDYNVALNKFRKFIPEWQSQHQFTYRNQLLDNAASGRYIINVDLDDVNNFDEILGSDLRTKPQELLPIFERAAKEVFCTLQGLSSVDLSPDFQVQVFSKENPKPLRDLKSQLLGKLVTVQGIIISASKPYVKAKTLAAECRQCHHVLYQEVGTGLGGPGMPRYCRNQQQNANVNQEKCPNDPYVIVPGKCRFIDQQSLKLQESPEVVPTGEIPRTYQICCDRYLASKLTPGSRVVITGIYQILEQKTVSAQRTIHNQLKIPYIKAVGFSFEKTIKRLCNQFTPEEEDMFKNLARDPQIYEKIVKNIAPSIYGHEDIKKAIACLMFGGSKKILTDKMRLRGDINVLLIGDPSTGKSQFLKFVERTAPVSVYTSGKGSSAAGLTASVNRDPQTGEFQVEGGAMVLADGGVVCIDEFDKMRPEDRVAIHEAMEQQTISVAKAGITTKLNSRVSVLAAANPIFGSYSDIKSFEEQIELQTTILSRFDCIFIVKDPKNQQHDARMAEHIIGLHAGNMALEQEQGMGDMDLQLLKKYVAYSRAKCFPRLSEKAAEKIQNLYVEDRQKSTNSSKQRKAHIPITVRQLEAIIRLSEAVAKISLSPEVREEHIDEGHRLFQNSTMNAISSGKELGVDMTPEMSNLIMKVEENIKRRVAINSKIDFSKLKEEMVSRFGNERAVDHSLSILIKNDTLKQVEGKRVLLRLK